MTVAVAVTAVLEGSVWEILIVEKRVMQTVTMRRVWYWYAPMILAVDYLGYIALIC